MKKDSEEFESPERGSVLGFLAVAGVLEIALLALAVIVLGVAYTAGLHIAILLAAVMLALFGFWKWTTRGK